MLNPDKITSVGHGLIALVILVAAGCESPYSADVAPDATSVFHAGKAFRSDGWLRIPWFELTTGTDRMVEGTVDWFDDLNHDGMRQDGEPSESSHEGEPGVPTARWRSGELRVPAAFTMPTLHVRVILESGAQWERTWPVQ
ncbi:MAG: hypothetical protein CMJ98_02180 [Planctomycetes bacterium]|jgi:hypothetical protein|nr:hypothetical protein [Planctomycetota bacterium]HIF41685.1 hypothetical protein [Planctomycetota bacterium]HIK61822.1 hypothetical protein [Planctomycetota bacterium]HJM55935.1 hypothetical protein [Planctomycetota bacterium]